MTDEPREQEIAPCPMPGCGGECKLWWNVILAHHTECENSKCPYRGPSGDTIAAAIVAHNALCADVQRGREAVAIKQERDALRAEVERLREAIERWADSIGELYSSNDLRGTDYFDYELKNQMEDEMRQAVSALRAALDAGQGEAVKP
jgi:hypothetical protein